MEMDLLVTVEAGGNKSKDRCNALVMFFHGQEILREFESLSV
jgi:hypothetical protein